MTLTISLPRNTSRSVVHGQSCCTRRYNGLFRNNDWCVTNIYGRVEIGWLSRRKQVHAGGQGWQQRVVGCGATTSDGRTHAGDVVKRFKKLQNGSDIRGIALGLNEEEEVTITPGMLYFVGKSFGTWLRESHNDGNGRGTPKVSVGADPRLSSPLLTQAIIAGLVHAGCHVLDFGMCTTPAMFMSCILPRHMCQGSVMITASHLPVNRNGAKFFTPEGGLGKPDIKVILEMAASMASQEGFVPLGPEYDDEAFVLKKALLCSPSSIETDEFLDVYAEHLRNIVIREVNHPGDALQPLKGLKVVVNPGNGSGGFFATKVLGPLGADVSASINLDPDGNFPAHQPNPEDKQAVLMTQEAVLSSGADLGIMLDTDVDRSGLVDKDGKGINRNRYIALAAAIALREHPGATIVTDSCTSNGLKDFISSHGGVHFRFKKGYKNIIDKGIELNEEGVNCPLMMETSGHGALRENYFLDDGAYGALKIVIETVKRRLAGDGDISDLLKDLKEPREAMEIRVRILASDVQEEGAKVTAAFKSWVDNGAGGNSDWVLEEENYEGWRVKIKERDGNQGWLLVRPSLHDPDIVINVESEEEDGMRTHLRHLLEFFEEHPRFQVSTQKVEDYVIT